LLNIHQNRVENNLERDVFTGPYLAVVKISRIYRTNQIVYLEVSIFYNVQGTEESGDKMKTMTESVISRRMEAVHGIDMTFVIVN
jgi:hypothetical protein